MRSAWIPAPPLGSLPATVSAYELDTGELLWQAPGMTPHPIPTPVAGSGLLIAASGSTERKVIAIDLSAGTAGTVVWKLDTRSADQTLPARSRMPE